MDLPDGIQAMKDLRLQLEEAIESRRATQLSLVSTAAPLVPDLVVSLDASLQLVAAFNGREFSPTLVPSPSPKPQPQSPRRRAFPFRSAPLPRNVRRKPSPVAAPPQASRGTDRLTLVRTMVAISLLELVPFTEIDSARLLHRLEGEQSSATAAERAALSDLVDEFGGTPTAPIENALRRIAEETGGVQVEEVTVGGKLAVMVCGIDRNKLLRELPEASVNQLPLLAAPERSDMASPADLAVVSRPPAPGAQPDMWMPSMYQVHGSPAPVVGLKGGPRGVGIMGVPRAMGLPPMQRPFAVPGANSGGGGGVSSDPRSEEDELKDIELMLNKKTYKEKQQSKTGEELLDLIHRPTAKETAVAAKFKSKGGSQVKEFCDKLTKDDCRRHHGSFVACDKVHFRRIIAPHTDTNLGDCSFLDTCRHTKTCKYVHYELDQTPDMPPMMMGSANAPIPRPIKPQRAEYCSEIELGEPQWINCDIRNFRMDILGQFGVIMADPPWDIHMELPYGTMADDEMRTLNVPALQTDGLIFLWVTGRAMELGRECLELWGYKRVEEIIWVKTNQLQRIIRTGRTGHWLNHSKEHCLVGIKGNPEVNRNIDTDVIVAEVRETSRKPDEMYPMLERISPRTRKLELFARMHNTHAGWLSLGNQLNGVRLVDDGLRGRFKAAYPDVEVQPPSPPRSSAPADTVPGYGLDLRPAGQDAEKVS